MDAVSLQRIAVSVAQERVLDVVLRRLVAELNAQPHVALARIWLIDKRHQCDACAKVQGGGERTAALHLVAGSGKSLHIERNEDWSKLDGHSRCIQLGNGKVGRIGATGESVFVEDAPHDQRWSMNRDWIRSESIASFVGHPLLCRGEIFGVIVVFSRERLAKADFELLRAFAELAAIAIANARDFEEAEHRSLRLESENAFLRQELDRGHAIGCIVAASPAIARLQQRIERAANGIIQLEIPASPIERAKLTREDLRRLETDNLRKVLADTNWKIYGPRGAAEVLRMKPTTLASRLKSLGIHKPAA